MRNLLTIALVVTALWSCNAPKEETPEAAKAEAPVVAEPQRPVEFADEKYTNICKDAMTKLAAGDVDAFLANYSDDAVYRWNSGDSIAGKPAITTYWKERRGKVITKLAFSEQIWLPLTVTEASTNNVRKGNWVLGWYKVDATYKTGKSMTQWMHMLYHLNSADKIDEVIQYSDRSLITAAAGK